MSGRACSPLWRYVRAARRLLVFTCPEARDLGKQLFLPCPEPFLAGTIRKALGGRAGYQRCP